MSDIFTGWKDGVYHVSGRASMGRPAVFISPRGEETLLPVHEAYIASRSLRQMAAFHRRGRKTGTTLEKVFKWLWMNPGVVGKTLAPIRKQAKEIIWDDPDMLFHPNVLPPQIIKSINKSDLSIVLKNGSVWSLDGADDPQKKRGGNVKVLHLTEAGDHQEELWTQIYEPILIANGGVVFFEGNFRGRNWYWRLFEAAKHRPGWATFLLSARNSPIFTPAELDDLEKNTPDAVFRSEYLCEAVDSLGTVFRNFDRLATSEPRAAEWGKKYRIGIDLAKNQDYTVVTVVDRHTWDEVCKDRFNSLDWTMIQDRIKQTICDYASRENENEVEVVQENNGVGDPVFDAMWRWSGEQAVMKKYHITMKAFTTTNASKALLVSNLSMLFDQGLIRIIKDETAMRELAEFTYKKTSSHFIYAAPDGGHDDCFVAGTMVLTKDGNLPIENIKVGDLVMTRKGLRPVIMTRCREKRVISRLGLTGTPEHPIITSRGDIGLAHVCNCDTVYVWNEKLSCIEEKSIIDILNQNGANSLSIFGGTTAGFLHQWRCIDRYGLIILERFRRGLWCTTKMVTHLITRLIICAVKACRSMHVNTLSQGRSNQALMQKRIFGDAIQLKPNVLFVEKNSFLGDSLGQSIVAVAVGNALRQIEKLWLWAKDTVYSVKNYSIFAHILQRSFAMVSAIEGLTRKKVMVFNLQVAGQPEYFANNILVHNCTMSMMVAYWDLGAKLPPPQAPDQGKTLWGFKPEELKAMQQKRAALERLSGMM